MNEALINFIVTHENDDLAKLLLKQKDILGYSTSFVVNQINGRRRAKEKLPTWYANPAITYPAQQNLEQCSSEITAQFKCDVIRGEPNETMADLTGGFGVDSFYFSRIFKKVSHIEPDTELCEMAKKNCDLLKSRATPTSWGSTTKYLTTTAEEFLTQVTEKLDWIYLDPSRKNNGKKVVRLSDSQPDVVALLPELFSKSDNILIKTSPLLDLKEGIRELPGAKKIFVVSVDNECKEVLFLLQKGWTNEPEIICINLLKSGTEEFQFKFSLEASAESKLSDPQSYLYEPNASILKAGAFKSVAQIYGLSKIAVSTHLYTSENYESEFPGRIFKLQSPLSERDGKEMKFNIISRNHPLSPEEIKKKFKLKDGGEKYVLAFSGMKKKFMLIAERLK